jgi:hypothetical protein
MRELCLSLLSGSTAVSTDVNGSFHRRLRKQLLGVDWMSLSRRELVGVSDKGHNPPFAVQFSLDKKTRPVQKTLSDEEI